MAFLFILIGSTYHVTIDEPEISSIMMTIEDTDGSYINSTDRFIMKDGQALLSIGIPKDAEEGEYTQRIVIDDGVILKEQSRIIRLQAKEQWWEKIIDWLRAFLP